MANSTYIPDIVAKFEKILLKAKEQDRSFIAISLPLLNKFQQVLNTEEKRLHDAIDLVKSELPHLLAAMVKVSETTALKAKQYAPDFNIFHIFKIERKEVTTHSAFLADLLDANGLHGQGSLFIDSFLRDIGLSPVSRSWVITSEMFAGHGLGRMDIVLQNEKSAVVIENKIDHIDEPSQLWRYGKWLEIAYEPGCIKKKDHFRIVYLTPNGRKPSKGSISKQLIDDPFELEYDDIMLWSYRKNVLYWLTNCIDTIDASSVKTIIRQYLKTIKEGLK